jgi:hypothetical protein
MAEKVTWQSEKDSLYADFKMREVQLKNINKVFCVDKALKEEVKKLNRTGSASSSVVGSPILSRSGSMDQGPSQSGLNSNLPPPSPPPTQSQSHQSNSRTSGSSTRTSLLPDPEPEYLKNVVLKFLESNKKVFLVLTQSQRIQLIGVLGMLLKFTPEELRLAQKVV